jgi:hypothetical protein
MNSIFPYVGNFIIPTDELIFFRGIGQPPTSVTMLRLSTTHKKEPFKKKHHILGIIALSP